METGLCSQPRPPSLLRAPAGRLSLYDGSDPKQPLLLALKGCVLDVSSGRDYYGPGASYNIFAGKDARRPPPSRAVAITQRMHARHVGTASSSHAARERCLRASREPCSLAPSQQGLRADVARC
mmetsp:Transcript_68138/g.186755  ORF Transcript_68138/g.186755 Transcript_68138/m.186755 type:complete len:124 (+) Transcript_68138:243-614(+)|eukprot:3421995-Prymnesium_polylepis.1